MLVRIQYKTTTVDGITMFVHSPIIDKPVSSMLLLGKVWEPLETDLFKSVLKPGMVVADVGANIGYYSLLAAQCVGNTGLVYAFEPATDNIRLLEKNIRMSRSRSVVRVFKKAVGGSTGVTELYRSQDNKGDYRTFGAKVPKFEPLQWTAAVDLISLDDVFAGESRLPDVIKLDVQGSEMEVWRGMSNLLAATPKLTVFTEIWPAGLSAANGSAREYIELMDTQGFKFTLIDNSNDRVESLDTAALVARAEYIQPEESLDVMCVRM